MTRHAYMIAAAWASRPWRSRASAPPRRSTTWASSTRPREVLNKPGRLSDEEFALIQRHPVDGAAMVAELATTR